MSTQLRRPATWQLFGIWASIGLQSFGGGASTILLIQRTFIERRHWLSPEEFTRLWSLSQLTPGINLIAVTILIGKQVGGVRGIMASVAGMLLPSASITVLLAALFLRIEHAAVVQQVMRGIVPATAGLMLLVVVNFARPIIRERATMGPSYLWVGAALLLVIALAIILWHVSVIVAVLGAALFGIVFFTSRTAQPHRDMRERKLL
jgi:chromate transporter